MPKKLLALLLALVLCLSLGTVGLAAEEDAASYTRYAYASEGEPLTLSAYLLDANGDEVDFAADSSYTFQWVKVTDTFVVYDEDEGTGGWEKTESDVLGTGSTYTIASVSANDYFDQSSDSWYYYICYIYQNDVLAATDYMNILDPSVWSGASSDIYANIGESVTLTAYLENADGYALDFEAYDYDGITFEWDKVMHSESEGTVHEICEVVGMDASYTIDALTAEDAYNTGSDTYYYYYACYIYQYGYQIATDTVYIYISDTAAATSGQCGDNAYWSYDATTGTLTITGTGDMYDYEYGTAPWYDYYYKITSVVLEEGITSIGNYAFMDCWMTSITLPDTLTSIGEDAFMFCTQLTGITLPDSLVSIGAYAFEWCNFESITIPGGVTSIGDGAFYACEDLETIKFLGDAPAIGEDAFFWAEATAYYPAGNATWTADVMQQYGGEITWVAYELSTDTGDTDTGDTGTGDTGDTGTDTSTGTDTDTSTDTSTGTSTGTDTGTDTSTDTSTSGSVQTGDETAPILVAMTMLLCAAACVVLVALGRGRKVTGKRERR